MFAASSHKQQVQRAFVRIALTSAQHGFDDLDQNLIYYSALMNDAYDVWYQSWARTVQVGGLNPMLANGGMQHSLHAAQHATCSKPSKTSCVR